MTRHLQQDIAGLRSALLSMSAVVEKRVAEAIRAVEEGDDDLARRLIAADDEIDRAEVAIEEDCLKILALRQPVAGDLRDIVATLKINNELERIGDLACNIAKRALALAGHAWPRDRFDFGGMAARALAMLRRAIDALARRDENAARDVLHADAEIDRLNRRVYGQVQDLVATAGSDLALAIQLLAVARHIERIGDHAGNIAEDVLFMVSGCIVRHGGPGAPGETAQREDSSEQAPHTAR